MKRILCASALALATASAAAAATVEATEQNLIAIQDFVPEATMTDLQAMSDTEIRVILNAINSGNDSGNSDATVRALFEDASAMDSTATATPEFVNEANLQAIQTYVPEATMEDLRAMSDAKIAAILNEVNKGEDGNDRAATVRALFEGDDSQVTHANATTDFVNEANLTRIQSYAPEATLADLAKMGDEEVASILNIIAGSEGEGDKRQMIQSRFE